METPLPEQEESVKYLTQLILLSIPLNSIAATHPSDEPLQAPVVRIQAAALEESLIYHSPALSVATKNSEDASVADTAERLPGVKALRYSGAGSLTTLSTQASTDAGHVGVSLEDIPIPDPLATGVNLNVIPETSFEAVSQSGRDINISLLKPKQNQAKPWRILTGAGSGLSGLTSLSYSGEAMLVGLSASATQGRFRYMNPVSGIGATIENNESSTLGTVFRYDAKLRGKAKAAFFQLLSTTFRHNPGSIDYPSSDRERDLFSFSGGKYEDPEFFDERSGLSAALAFSHSAVSAGMGGVSPGVTTSQGAYSQVLTSMKRGNSSCSFGADDRYSRLATDTQAVWRNVPGLKASGTFPVSEAALTPSLRVDSASHLGVNADAGVDLVLPVSEEHAVGFGYAYTHSYPDLPSTEGYSASGYSVRGNPDLDIERSHSVSFTHAWQSKNTSAFTKLFLARNIDRPVLVWDSNSAAHAESYAKAFLGGLTTDLEERFGPSVFTRASLGLGSFNDMNAHALPYKPVFSASFTFSYRPHKSWLISAQEEHHGPRYADRANLTRLPADWTTSLSASTNELGGKAILKLGNIFNQSGYVTNGYPILGRTVWVGYEL